MDDLEIIHLNLIESAKADTLKDFVIKSEKFYDAALKSEALYNAAKNSSIDAYEKISYIEARIL